MTTFGCDVSHYQTAQKTADAIKGGARFVIAKATEGESGVDAMHGLHVATARAGHVDVGHYHFARDEMRCVQEEEHFLANAHVIRGDAVMLDLEAMTPVGNWPGIVGYAVMWVQRVAARTGARPIWYTNLDWRHHFIAAATPAQLEVLNLYPEMIATGGRPAGQPGITGWEIHQYDTKGGIDHDVLAPGVTWSQFAIPVAVPVPPAPSPHPVPVPYQEDLVKIFGPIPGYDPKARFKLAIDVDTREPVVEWVQTPQERDRLVLAGAVLATFTPAQSADLGTILTGPKPKPAP